MLPLPHQTPAYPEKKIVAIVNLASSARPQRRSQDARQRFFYLQVDSCSNLNLVGPNVPVEGFIATENEYVMMNAHPEKIMGYGTLRCEAKDEATEAWTPMTIENVAVVPGSNFNLLGWTPFAKQLASNTTNKMQLIFEGTTVRVPLDARRTVVGAQRGGLFSLRCRLAHRTPPHVAHPSLAAVFKAKLEPEPEPERAEEEEKKKNAIMKKVRWADEKEKSEEQRALEEQLVEKGAVAIAKARALMFSLHRRLGHTAKIGSLQSMIRKGEISVNNAVVRETMLKMEAKELCCVECDLAQVTKTHPNKKNSAVMEGQWTMDESGKYWRSRRGNRYVTVVVAPEGRGVFVECLKKRSGLLGALMSRRKVWQRTAGVKMTRLRMDRAGEHTGKKMTCYLAKHGIVPSYTSPNSSAGPAEAYIHLLQDSMASMLNDYAKIHKTSRPHHLWDYAFEYAAEVKSMTWCTTNDGMSMYEKRHGRPPPLHKCHVFGATVFAHVPKELRRKGDNRGRIGRFLGFSKDGDGFVLADPKTGKVFHSGSIRVYEDGAGAGLELKDEPAKNAAAMMGAEKEGYEFGVPARAAAAPEHAQPAAAVELQPEHAPAQPQLEVHAFADEEKEGGAPPVLGKRVRKQNEQMNIGHDEWQTLITSATTAVDAATSYGKKTWSPVKKRDGQKSAHLAKLQDKLSSTRNFLRARRGGQNPALLSGMIPTTEAEMWSCEDVAYWVAARKEEMDGLREKQVMEMVRRDGPEAAGRSTVKSKFVYDIKLLSPTSDKTGPTYRTLEDGKKVRYKARLVGKGFTQEPGVDFDVNETYAPTPQISSIRLLLALGFSKGWDSRQLDAKQAFLISELKESEQMLMEPPPGADFDNDYLFLLLRSLYGLRQSAHHWHKEIKGTLIKHGFTCLVADQGIYVRYNKNGDLQCALALHVDDCLVSAPPDVMKGVTDKLKATYEMTDTPADWFLKIKIATNEDNTKMSMSQPDYARDIIRAAGLTEQSTAVKTPMEAPLSKGDSTPPTEEEEEYMASQATAESRASRTATYGTVVGMLSYLSGATRPDLAYAVGQVQRYTAQPRRAHWQALVRIVRYLVGTPDHGIMFCKGLHADETMIVGFVDSDWAGNLDDRTSSTGYAFMIMNAVFSYKSKRQSGTKNQERPRPGETVGAEEQRRTADAARSSAEAELRALDLAGREALWLRQLAAALKMDGADTIPIHEDNEACYHIAKGSQWSAASKHMDVMYKAICSDIEDKRVDLLPVASADNLADMFTKPLKAVLFARMRTQLGVVDLSPAAGVFV